MSQLQVRASQGKGDHVLHRGGQADDLRTEVGPEVDPEFKGLLPDSELSLSPNSNN